MFGPLDAGLALLIQQGQLGNTLASHAETTLAAPIVHFLVEVRPPHTLACNPTYKLKQALEDIKLRPERIINNIALTQKDSFASQLHIGVRFFDFRPGFCFHDVIHARKGVIHHQHAMVPGPSALALIPNSERSSSRTSIGRVHLPDIPDRHFGLLGGTYIRDRICGDQERWLCGVRSPRHSRYSS